MRILSPRIQSGGAMQYDFRSVGCTIMLLALLCIPCAMSVAQVTDTATAHAPSASEGLAPAEADCRIQQKNMVLPYFFALNQGQWDDRILASSIPPGTRISFGRDGYALALRSESPHSTIEKPSQSWPTVRFQNADVHSHPEGLRPQSNETIVHRWSKSPEPIHATAYAALVYRDVWPGVDIHVDGEHGMLRHTIEIAPGSDPSSINISFSGIPASSLQLLDEKMAGAALTVRNDAGVQLSVHGAPSAVGTRITLLLHMAWGGSGKESKLAVRYNSRDEIVMTGFTESEDFPISIGPGAGYPSTTGLFVTTFSNDCKQLIFSTQGVSSWAAEVRGFRIAPSDEIVLLLKDPRPDLPLTRDAHYTESSSYALLVLRDDGSIRYASFVPTTLLQEFVDMDIDGLGAVYLFAHTYFTTPLVTPNALFRVNQGIEDGFIMKYDRNYNQLVYATHIGGTTMEEYIAIAVEQCGAMAVFGPTNAKDAGYPLVNPIQSKPVAGGTTFVLSKIDRSGQNLLYSTFLDGSLAELFVRRHPARTMRFDGDGNLYIIAETSSPDFPMHKGLGRELRGATEIVVMKISPTGELLWSSFLGGSGYEQARDLEIDDNGVVAVVGTTMSADFPRISPLPGAIPGSSTFLTIIEPSGDHLTRSTPIAHSQYGDVSVNIAGDELLLALTGSPSHSVFPITAGGMPSPRGSDDILLTKLSIAGLLRSKRVKTPFGETGPLHVTLEGPDTIVVDVARNSAIPNIFHISLAVENTSRHRFSQPVDMRIEFSSVFTPLPRSPGTRLSFNSVLPGEILRWQWTMTIDAVQALLQQPLTFSAHMTVSTSDCGEPVSMTFIRRHVIFVIRKTDAIPAVQCSLSLKARPELNSGQDRLKADSCIVQFSMWNTGAASIPLYGARLQLIGDGVVLLSPYDTHDRRTSTLLPGESWQTEWVLKLPTLPSSRIAYVSVAILDPSETVITACDAELDIPGVPASSCTVIQPARLVWYSEQQRIEPDPIPVTLTIHNHTDSLRWYRSAWIEFSPDSRLQLVPTEAARTDRFNIRDHYRRSFTWNCMLRPGVTSLENDTVSMYYEIEDSGFIGMCLAVLTFKHSSDAVLCDVFFPDPPQLDPVSNTLLPNPFEVAVAIENSSNAPVLFTKAILILSPDSRLAAVEPEIRQLQRVFEAYERDTLRWSLIAGTEYSGRIAEVSAVIFVEDDISRARCPAFLHIPAIMGNCQIDAPDTIHVDRVSGTFEQDPIDVTLRVFNETDSLFDGLYAVLDSSVLGRFTLSGSTSTLMPLPPIAAHSEASATWKLSAIPATLPSDVRISASVHDSTLANWSRCDVVLHVEGTADAHTLQCAVSGHDSLWVDQSSFTMLPDPLQLRFSVKNIGSEVLENCSIAILNPSSLPLVDNRDSVRIVTRLLPGDEVDIEWLLNVRQDEIVPGRIDVPLAVTCSDVVLTNLCVAGIAVVPGVPTGIVLTPWLLRFEAEQRGPLPSAQYISVWSGSSGETWNMLAAAPWLFTDPTQGSGHTAVSVQPSTTDLAPALYHSTIRMSSIPRRTGEPQVLYHISTPLHVGTDADLRRFSISGVYPNPMAGGAEVRIRVSLPLTEHARLSIYNALGQEIAVLHDGVLQGGEQTLRLSIPDLPTGTYFHVLRVGRNVTARGFVIVR
jgi:hypothetical protein